MKSILLAWSLPLLAGLLVFAADTSTTRPAGQDLSVADFAARLGQPNSVVLDVRTREEFDAGHLAGATLCDFRQASFEQDVAKLDRSKTYMVYCRSGHRSALACEVMARLGFEHRHNLLGGINAWAKEGRPVAPGN